MQRVAVDIETTLGNKSRSSPYQDKIIIIAVDDGHDSYLVRDVSQIEDMLADPSILKIFHNGAFDIQFLEYNSFDLRVRNIWDTMIMERLLTAGMNEPCDLPGVVWRHCDVVMSKDLRQTFFGHRGPLSSEQENYVKGDVRYLRRVQERQEAELAARGMTEIASIENRLVPTVARMELAGLGFDREAWDSILQVELAVLPEFEATVQRALSSTFQMDILTGGYKGTINLNSPKQLMAAFQRKGVSLDDTQESTLKDIDHPAVAALLAYREHEKRTQWDYPQYVNPATGKIHPNFVQTGADTGRFSCKTPNLQNVPKEERFRRMFIPSPGYVFIVADYGQQELRVLAEASQDPNLIRACRTTDPHLENARLIYSEPKMQKSDPRRNIAKNCSFALAYGASLRVFAMQAGIPMDQARHAYDSLHRNFSRADQWGTESWDFLRTHGYVVTLGGRRRYFPWVAEDPGKYHTVAKNTPIQGTSADMMKLAMVYVAEALEPWDAWIVGCIHDELIVEARKDQAESVARIVETEMIRAGEHYVKSVPTLVEATISPCWLKE